MPQHVHANVIPRTVLRPPLNHDLAAKHFLKCTRCVITTNTVISYDFLKQHLKTFAEKYPTVSFYIKPRINRPIVIHCDYNGSHLSINVSRHNIKETGQWLNHLLQTDGGVRCSYKKHHFTNFPSIQGIWNNFTYRDSIDNILKFPMHSCQDSRFSPIILENTATQEALRKHKLNQNNSV
ncbi:MAG: 39S ribosomal protein L43, mitochondrial [Marteilia pararefringens]